MEPPVEDVPSHQRVDSLLEKGCLETLQLLFMRDVSLVYVGDPNALKSANLGIEEREGNILFFHEVWA